MSVVISEVEHRPSADAGTDAAVAAPPQGPTLSHDEIQTMLRRARSRRARLWAD